MAGVTTPRSYVLVVRNDVGQVLRRIDLLQKNLFGSSPEGQGIEFERSYFSSNGSHYNYDTDIVMARMSFNVVIGAVSDPYGTYHRFLNDLDGNLSLEYTAQGLPHTHSRDVAIYRIVQPELDRNGVLNIELELDCLTPWSNWVNLTPMLRDNGVTFIINNDSMYLNKKKMAPLNIEIRNEDTTPIVNPHFTYNQGDSFGDSLGEFRWIGNIPPNHSLIMSTGVSNGRCVLRNLLNNIETDVTSQLDITCLNFLMATKGVSRLDSMSSGLLTLREVMIDGLPVTIYESKVYVQYLHERLVV